MHIKQVIVDGYKSYGDRIVFEPFHKGHTVIVGCNGAGKSNLFDAIQFVVRDEYAILKPKLRRQLIHATTGPRLGPSFVELIFDNSDQSFPILSHEVSIRRVFDENKDEYLVNKQLTPRPQVMALLQSAGFMSHNPYYIIPQGKINEFAMASNAHRLKFVQEIAGMKVYEEKFDKCVAYQKTIQVKLRQIQDHIVKLQESLGVLILEKEEFLQYEEQKKIRCTLKHIIYEADILETKKKLEELISRREESSKQPSLSNQLYTAEDKIAFYSNNIKKITRELMSLKEERDIYNDSYEQIIREEVKIKLSVEDLEKKIRSDTTSSVKAQNELLLLNYEISEKEEKLQKRKPEYQVVKENEIKCKNNLLLKEQRLKELYCKYYRRNQFSCKGKLNCWILEKLGVIDQQIANRCSYKILLKEDIQKNLQKEIELNKTIEHCVTQMANQRRKQNSYENDNLKFNHDKDEYQSTRNKLWHKENKAQENLSILKDELESIKYKMKSLPGKQLLVGCDSVRHVLDTFKNRGGSEAKLLKGYLGTLMDNFKCKKELYTAVEVTVGTKLFYHIVDSDKTANFILKEMKYQGLKGEVNFLPLNRLIVKNYAYPENMDDAISMIDQLEFEGFVDKAFRYMFGKTLLCRDLDIAIKMGRKGYDCITLEGDRVASTGIFTGGYIDRSKLRLETKQIHDDLLSQIMEVERKMDRFRITLEKIDLDITKLISETQKTEMKIMTVQRAYETYNCQLKSAKNELATIENLRDSKEKSLAQCRSNVEVMKITKGSLEVELKENFSSKLSVAYETEVNSLKEEIQHLREEHKDIFNRRIALEEEQDKFENMLANNVTRKRDEVLRTLQENSFGTYRDQFSKAKTKWNLINSKIYDVKARLFKMDHRIRTSEENLEKQKAHLYAWYRKEDGIKKEICESAQILDKFKNTQSLLQKKIVEITRSIDELEMVPSLEFYNRYESFSYRNILAHFEDAKRQINNLNFINKKSPQMVEEVAINLDNYERRKKELIVNLKDVTKVLNSLEAYKIDAMFNSFELISKYFSENFKRLVPEGKATMVMLTIDNKYHEVLPQDAEFASFIGIALRVSFVESQFELRDIIELSGAQKSLISLALIFAFQKCSPAPFYLFDEIDQTLDKQNKVVIANMILEISKQAQCITTTFAQEMIECANKFYGVQYANKSSYLTSITQECAISSTQKHL